LVGSQVYVFLFAVVGGMIIGFIYDLFRIKRKAIVTGRVAIFIEDTLYWIIATVVMFLVVYKSNDGELRTYIFIGVALGVILYALVLSKIVVSSAIFILRVVYKSFKLLWKIVSYPFKIIIKILAIPASFLKRCIRSLCKKSVHITRNQKSKSAMWKKIFRSRRKKL
jgi:spore cortex biosynthesis protein YabQ